LVVVAARSPADVSPLPPVGIKRSEVRGSSCELFSAKIESERPITVIRTDSTGHVTCSRPPPQLMLSNVFVPISVSEHQSHQYSDEELATLYDYQTLELLRAAPFFSETVSIDATDHQPVAVELLKLKKSTLDVQQKALPRGYKMVASVAGPQTFSETLSIDTCDHQAVAIELLKKKSSTLDVHQHAVPQGYRMIADISGPQTFSETVSVDSEDRRPVGIELLKLKTSAMDVQRHALPKGVKLEAEVLEPKPETTRLYIARTKCVEASVEKPVEDGRAPVFIVELQPVHTMDGGKATLVCRVDGRPMPVATKWSRDGKTVPADNPELTTSYDQLTGDASLCIAEVFPEDAGLYECYAENKYGQARTNAQLIIEGRQIHHSYVLQIVLLCGPT